MTNLSFQSNEELSLMVFNTECLYNVRHDSQVLFHMLDTLFIYNEAQLKELKEDLAIDLEEIKEYELD